MQPIDLGRRRFIAIAAAVGTTPLWATAGAADDGIVEWRGVALGAAARIRLAHPDRAAGQALLARCVAEARRLERVFSLYRADSEICRLNAARTLAPPAFEMVELLSYAAQVSAASGGAFDVTVQPLWQLYRAHFAQHGADPAGPDVGAVLPLVDWQAVSVAADRIDLRRPGMAITLNGIAQGYITDRVAELLRGEGMTSVLVDLGETRALGARPEGGPWRAGLADPARPDRIGARLGLRDVALATSGGYATPFDAAGRFNHLLDPRSGRSAPARRAVSVLAPRATIADAASTALALLPEAEAPALLRKLGARAAYIQDGSGLRILQA